MNNGLAQFGQPVLMDYGIRDGKLRKAPEFYSMDWNEGDILRERVTQMSIPLDTFVAEPIVLLVNEIKAPVMYTTNIATPVCADGECKLMHIRLYWDLLGGYAGFDRVVGQPLTKLDHVDFEMADYIKLHPLLQDNNSILKRRTEAELLDKPKEHKPEEVDAISGATIAEVKESIVAGALYSCYVAWNLVNGEVNEMLKKYTMSILDDTLLERMLASSSSGYQIFALEKLNDSQYESYLEHVAEIFKTGIPLVRTFIIKDLPAKFWTTDALQLPFWDSFAEVDINSRSSLLKHIEHAPQMAMEFISGKLNVMTKNQLKIYLDAIDKYPSNPVIMNNLYLFANANDWQYAYIVAAYLENRNNQ